MHSDLWFTQNRGLTQKAIRDFENAMSINLPKNYVDYLRSTNGSVPKFGSMHNKPSRKFFLLESLFPLPRVDLTWNNELAEESLPVVEIAPSEIRALLSKEWLPIGEAIDPDPGILLLNISPNGEGAVHFLGICNLCDPEQSEPCFDGFGDLVEALSKGGYAVTDGKVWSIETRNCSLETIVSLLGLPLPMFDFYVRPRRAAQKCFSLRITDVASSAIANELCGTSQLRCYVHDNAIRFDFSSSQKGKWTKLE